MPWRILPVACFWILLISCTDSSKDMSKPETFIDGPLSDALRALPVSFGDNVRIVSVTATEELEIAGLTGQVYGETTVSVTGVEVIGGSHTDTAVNVFIEELNKDYWLSPDLVELIDHAPGTTVSIGDREWIRTEDGQWKEVDDDR
jgi:hypothetical protein